MDDTPLVPILRTDDGQVDPVALATWHEALSNTVAVEVPHDLMGLWLYPAHGGVVLLAPSELAQDDLIVPVPAPQLNPEQLSALEGVVQKAGYGSVTCLPVRFGKRDVALLLVANLEPNRYGEVERSVLQCVAQRIGPLLGRVARQWKLGEGRSSLQQERIAGLLETVARANREASTPQRFIATLSQGLAALLPHEHIELLLPDKTRGGYFRLGEHAGGALWGDPSLIIDAGHLNIADIFGARSRLLVADTYEDGRWPRGFLTASEPAGADIRALVGVRLNLRGKTSAYLLVGSIGSDLYGEEDLEVLVLLAGLITPQIAGFIPTEQPPSQLPAQPAAPEPLAAPAAPPEHEAYAELLSRVAGLLATTADWSVVTQLVASEAISVLPCDKLTFVLRVTGGERVVVLDPGERRPLSSLPLISVTGTALARVLQGSLPCAFEQHDADTRLSVPLRVAGRIHGALSFSATAPKNLTERHVVPIQHLADIVAAHLELLRRTSHQPHPTVSHWRHHQSSIVSRQSSGKGD